MTATIPPIYTRDELDAYGPIGRSSWMDVDWREHLRWVDVDGDRINLVDLGGNPSGPTLVFVHGLGGSWTNWLENLLPFAADHRVIALDLPGFGASPMPREPISMPGYAARIDRLLDRLDVAEAVIVGNSMGGLIAAEMAVSHPERVHRLVLVAAAGLTSASTHNPQAFSALRRLEPGLRLATSGAAQRALTLSSRAKLRRLAFSLATSAPEVLPGPLVAEQVRGMGKQGFMPASEALVTYPMRDRVGTVTCPTLVVWGTRDRLVPVRDATRYEQLIPGARKVVYRRTGHMPQLERPARFNTDLREFVGETRIEHVPARPTAQ